MKTWRARDWSVLRSTCSTVSENTSPGAGLRKPRVWPPTTASASLLLSARILSRLSWEEAVSRAELLISSRDWSASATRMYASHPSREAPSCVISRGSSNAFDQWTDLFSSRMVRCSATTSRESNQSDSRELRPNVQRPEAPPGLRINSFDCKRFWLANPSMLHMTEPQPWHAYRT
jgi:hypothetical protein